MTSKAKIAFLIAICLLIIIFNSACSDNIGVILDEGLLSVDDVKESLEKEGLVLTKVKAKSPMEDYIDILPTPSAYKVNDNGGKIFLYQFQSISERKKYFPNVYSSFEIEGETIENALVNNVKNIIIVFEPKESGKALLDVFQKIGNAVFYRMHDVNKTEFKGYGESWAAKLYLEYFEYEWKDDKENANIERYGQYDIQLKFLNQGIETVKDLKYTFNIIDNNTIDNTMLPTRMSTSMSRGFQDDYGVLNQDKTLTSFNTTYDYPIGEDVINLTIEWDGQKEEVVLETTQ
ncbi:hypothetical protein [Desulfuribacillus alkaliarsenatis]|uniref:Uncharacterized protein n=1 Tax=Desulfuribacillus alkaliarsenatis TaxID=766136 RepID=A0A1E5G3J5_9FIRM|nr:hypothetical protein [Desulfuribacillus alkaliarsenatis]OEF97554.1 hypothetical protein BHF68_04935 [Desulfuribacillus alkaliarsenatis]